MTKNTQFQLIGERILTPTGEILFEKGYGGNNDGYFYKNEEVFLYGDPNEYCYISEYDAPYSRNDILAITGGNVEYATEIFYAVDWQSIDTYVDEDLSEGEVYRCSNHLCGQLHIVNDSFKCPTCGAWFEDINEHNLPEEILSEYTSHAKEVH